jgi:hypothetical protein
MTTYRTALDHLEVLGSSRIFFMDAQPAADSTRRSQRAISEGGPGGYEWHI